MARRFMRRGARRPRRNWQWARFTSNDTGVVAPPNAYIEDLLTTWKAEYGFSVNLPDITIWRVRFRVSIRITYPAAIVNPESYGVVLGLYTDNIALTQLSVATKPYFEKYMWYETIYVGSAVMNGAPFPVANGTLLLHRDFDVRARRRLANVEDTLILNVAATGGLLDANGLSFSGSVLMSLGRR